MSLKMLYSELKNADQIKISVGPVSDVLIKKENLKIVLDEALNFILVWDFKTETTVKIKNGTFKRARKGYDIYTEKFLYQIKLR